MNREEFSEPVGSFPHTGHTVPPSGRPTYHLIRYTLRSVDQAETSPEINMPPPVLLALGKACSSSGCLLLARTDALRRVCSKLSDSFPARALQCGEAPGCITSRSRDTVQRNGQFCTLEQTNHIDVAGGPAATAEARRSEISGNACLPAWTPVCQQQLTKKGLRVGLDSSQREQG